MNTGNKKLDDRSKARLALVHPDLIKLFEFVAKNFKTTFIITEGLRTPERQKQLIAVGASQTTNSKHLVGRAVDVAIVVDGEIRWDWPLYGLFAQNVKAAAASLEIPITWGGDWKTLRDGPHFELK